MDLNFRRCVSLENEHSAACSVEVTPKNQDIELVVNSGISTRNSNTGSQHCVEGEMRMLPGGILRLMTHTNESNVPISVH